VILRSWAERFTVINRRRFNSLLVIFLVGTTACGASPSPIHPQVVNSAGTEIAVKTAVAATLTAIVPTNTPTLAPTDTPTTTPTFTPSPNPTNTPAPPPGVYVTALELNPSSPRYHQEVTFKATFLNTTGNAKDFKWFVSMWLSAQSNRFRQTSWDKSFAIPPGASTFETYSPGWKLTGSDLRYPPCVPFTAKVQWREPPPDNSESFFVKTNGQDFQLPFEVCPP
jgi:hypothetical protein